MLTHAVQQKKSLQWLVIWFFFHHTNIKKNYTADILNIKTVRAKVCNFCTTKLNNKNNDRCPCSGYPNIPRIYHLVEQTERQNNEEIKKLSTSGNSHRAELNATAALKD